MYHDDSYRIIPTVIHPGGSIGIHQQIREYIARECMLYLRDDDRHRAPFGEPPVVCNDFYHEEITKSAKKGK